MAFREDTSIIPESSVIQSSDNNFLTVENASVRHSGSGRGRTPSPRVGEPTILLAGEELLPPAESPVIIKKGGKALKGGKKGTGRKGGRDRSPEVEQVFLADEAPLPSIPEPEHGVFNRDFADESDAWAAPPEPPRHRPVDLVLADEGINLESPPTSPMVVKKGGKKSREDEKKLREKEKRNAAKRTAEVESIPTFGFGDEPLVERVGTPTGRGSPKPSLASRIMQKLSPSPKRRNRSLSPSGSVRYAPQPQGGMYDAPGGMYDAPGGMYDPPQGGGLFGPTHGGGDDPYAFDGPRVPGGNDFFGGGGGFDSQQPLDLGIPQAFEPSPIDHRDGRESAASGVYHDALDPVGTPATMRQMDIAPAEDLLGDTASMAEAEPEESGGGGWFNSISGGKKGGKKNAKAAAEEAPKAGVGKKGAKGKKK